MPEADVLPTDQQTATLAESFFGGAPEGTTQPPPVTEPKKEEPAPAEPKVPEPPSFNEIEYLKSNFGYESLDDAKREIEELKKLKAEPQKVFATEEDKTKFIEDLYKTVSEKKKYERLSKMDLNNIGDALEVVKLGLKAKHSNSDLSDDDINDIIQEQYQRYPKPVKDEIETDVEYEAKLQAWKTREESVDRKIVRDAKIVKPELIESANKIVIPEIPAYGSKPQEPSQEDLAAFNKAIESFKKSAEVELTSFKGFETLVKDKDVEMPVSFELSQEDKSVINNYVSKFAENLNANAIFADRWLNKDGSINAAQMVKDLANIHFNEKASQKFANDAAAKRLELFIKDKKNIKIDGGGTPTPLNNEKSMSEKMQENFWGA